MSMQLDVTHGTRQNSRLQFACPPVRVVVGWDSHHGNSFPIGTLVKMGAEGKQLGLGYRRELFKGSYEAQPHRPCPSARTFKAGLHIAYKNKKSNNEEPKKKVKFTLAKNLMV